MDVMCSRMSVALSVRSCGTTINHFVPLAAWPYQPRLFRGGDTQVPHNVPDVILTLVALRVPGINAIDISHAQEGKVLLRVQATSGNIALGLLDARPNLNL